MSNTSFYQYIRTLRLDPSKIENRDEYPFSLKVVQNFTPLELHPGVTFFVGENGSGKSTLLEAIAVAYGLNPEGGTRNFDFSTADTHSELSRHLRVGKGATMPKNSFFLRAESFYNVATAIDQMDQGGGGPRIIDSYGGKSLHQQSHGESFMSLMMHRFGENGVYILDEPEAALSPMRQMAMLSRLHDLVKAGSQFLIATHSPILLAYPNSIRFNVDDGFKVVDYRDTDHFQIMQSFLNNTDKMLEILMT